MFLPIRNTSCNLIGVYVIFQQLYPIYHYCSYFLLLVGQSSPESLVMVIRLLPYSILMSRQKLCHLHLPCTTMIFWLLSALYLSTNAINIFPTLASKSLMKILNDIEARIDPWETQLNNFCQADVESLIPEWKNNLYWLIYWMSLIFSCLLITSEKIIFKWIFQFSLKSYCRNPWLPFFSWNTRNCMAMYALTCVHSCHDLWSVYTEESQSKNQA